DPESHERKHDKGHAGQQVRAAAQHHVDRHEAERAHEQQRDDRDRRSHVSPTRCRRRCANSRMHSSPNAKPPMCAKYATPPPPPERWNRSKYANTACWMIQIPRKRIAGNSRIVKKKMMKTSVTTRARGNRIR